MFSKSVRAAFVTLTALAVSISATQSLSIKVNGISHVSLPMICMFILSPGPPAVDTVEHLKIVATITNTGDETLKVLNDPRGPLNKLPTDTFVITDAKGAQPSFTGIKLKYVPKTAAALGVYTILAPGKSVAVEHDRRYLPRSSFLVCCSRYTFLSI
jgi:peptidyl-Lys metalloendopeptidase